MFVLFLFPVLMLKMVPKVQVVQDLHWKEIKRKRAWCYNKIVHSGVNPFYIVQIVILKCHQNQCQETLALLVNGMLKSVWQCSIMYTFFVSFVSIFILHFLTFHHPYRIVFIWRPRKKWNNENTRLLLQFTPFALSKYLT